MSLFNPNQKLYNMRVKPDPVSAQDGVRDNGKWSEKVIKMLIKKHKKSVGELEKVLTSKNPCTPCIPTTKICTTKSHSLHHSSFVFCKIWRWADLQSVHELKSIDKCNYSSYKTPDEACANPYHYVRIEKPSLAPVLIPNGPYACSPTTPNEMPPGSFLPSYDSTQIQTPTPDCPDFSAFTDSNLSTRDPMHNVQSYATPPPAYSEESASDRSSPPSFGNCLSNPTSPYFSSHSTSTIPSPPESAAVYPRQPSSVSYEPSFAYTSNTIKFEEQKHWCTIHYYEMENRVGEPFYASKSTLFIDGFTDPSSDERFCLGLLGNIHRDQEIEIARRHINKGVKLTYIAGEVFAECLSSDSAIFVQSPNCNLSSGWHPATVCKLPSTCTLNIFNYQDFAQLLSNSVSKGYEAVFQLTRMCTIRISFVKGWGAEYRRQTVTSTPCWIEIHLNGALQWLDRVLQGMGTPLNTCSSRS
ncbi:Smad2/3 [Oopsacas minuta]|uniref:Mothers against decapentaplegic homolog n=1 Tax=Oopsacas minuta TaxID=111878 RepID=A0AAV7KHV9_9METZ|nr:Smad2/3 [Oopsacas minuta]